MTGSRAVLPFAALLLIAAAPQGQEEDAAKEPEKTDDERVPDADDIARDAAMQPLRDTNLKKREINPLLEEAAADPYSLDGMRRCKDVSFAVMRLDDVLGPDVDAADPMTLGQKRRKAGGEIAKSLVGGLIPFRGVVREVTGAGGAQRRYHEAWEAGLMRRAFLKGYAMARKCQIARPLPGSVSTADR